MSALDSLDEELETAPAPGAPSPAKAQQYVENLDPEELKARRSHRWEALIPDAIQGPQREKLEATLDLAHFAMGWPVNKLAGQVIAISNEIAEQTGREPDDEKVARETGRRMIRSIEAAALSANPYATMPPETEVYLNKMSAYARTLGWSPTQIASTLQGALVLAEGDKTLAAGIFANHIIGEHHERGYRGSVSLDQLEGFADRGSDLAASEDPSREDYTGADLEDDRTARMPPSKGRDESGLPEITPELEPYPPNRLATVYVYRDDQGRMRGYSTTTEELHEDVRELEVRARIADEKIAVLDKVAAATLKPVDYAVYRIMREEAYRINNARDRDIDASLAQVVQRQLAYDHAQGADTAMNAITNHSAPPVYAPTEAEPLPGETLEQLADRLGVDFTSAENFEDDEDPPPEFYEDGKDES
jgi:hypothetical protein